MFVIPNEVSCALTLFKNAGFEAYLVGGCVRDYIMNRHFNDFDITTNATPSEVIDVFEGYKVVQTGIKHGTVTVIINKLPLEITTYRIDGKYNDGRHPENVTFSKKLTDDLKRRDFTVNAMAYNGEIIDVFGGIQDINDKIIRCVGNPDERFNEDALRIMRALRFSSVLMFDIEDETSKSILQNYHLLSNISTERIYSEFLKLLSGDKAGNVLIKYKEVFISLFDRLNFSESWQNINTIENDSLLRLAYFFLNDELYKNNYKKLKPDNKSYNRVCNAIEGFKITITHDAPSVKRFLRKHGKQAFRDVVELKRCEGIDISALCEIYTEIIKNNECFDISGLNINGNDIKKLGYTDAEIGVILNMILDNVIDGKLENSREELIKFTEETKI